MDTLQKKVVFDKKKEVFFDQSPIQANLFFQGLRPSQHSPWSGAAIVTCIVVNMVASASVPKDFLWTLRACCTFAAAFGFCTGLLDTVYFEASPFGDEWEIRLTDMRDIRSEELVVKDEM